MNAMYCSEQINIPPELGAVLKQYTKAVIRAQPRELFKWSANYFAGLLEQAPYFDAAGVLVSQQSAPPRESNSGDAKMVADVITGAGGFEAVPNTNDGNEAIVANLFTQYDVNGSGRLERSELPALIADLKVSLGLDISEEQMQEIVGLLDTDKDGTISLAEFRQLFFQ